jgi:hypothetical protein
VVQVKVLLDVIVKHVRSLSMGLAIRSQRVAFAP